MSNILKPVCVVVALALVLSLGVALLPVGQVHAATINVPGDQATIQLGIDNANPGDTVLVAADTYYETLTIDKSLILQASGEVILDADGAPDAIVMTLDAETVSLTALLLSMPAE